MSENKKEEILKIPIKDCLITSHKCPDGDAISSSIAVYNYIKKNKKKVCIKLIGPIPKNFEWMLGDIKLSDEVPKWVKQVIVLDSDFSKDRLGWKIPDNVPVLNIDHHIQRIDKHDPKNGIFVFDDFSTASILFRKFGISDDLLVIGAYTDTYFAKNIKDVFTFILDLGVPEDKIEEFINKVNMKSDRRTWKIIRDSKIHRCKNGFVIVETLEDDPMAIESAMRILCSMNETVCLIFGDKQVKLRTSDKELDLSEIAKKFSGGGHPFASGINKLESITEFKDYIIHYER